MERVIRRKRQDANQANVSEAFGKSAAPGITQDGKKNQQIPGGSGLTPNEEMKKKQRAEKRKAKKEAKKKAKAAQQGNGSSVLGAAAKPKPKRPKGRRVEWTKEMDLEMAYAHTPLVRQPTAAEIQRTASTPCRYYAMNVCNKGSKCYFLHDDNNLSLQPCTPRGTAGKGKGKGKESKGRLRPPRKPPP